MEEGIWEYCLYILQFREELVSTLNNVQNKAHLHCLDTARCFTGDLHPSFFFCKNLLVFHRLCLVVEYFSVPLVLCVCRGVDL